MHPVHVLTKYYLVHTVCTSINRVHFVRFHLTSSQNSKNTFRSDSVRISNARQQSVACFDIRRLEVPEEFYLAMASSNRRLSAVSETFKANEKFLAMVAILWPYYGHSERV